MNTIVFETPGDFLAHARPWLEANELAANLPLATAARLAEASGPPAQPPFFAVVEDAGAIVLAAMRTPPWKLGLFGAEAGEEAAALVAQTFHKRGWDTPGVMGPRAAALRFAECWRARTGRAFRESTAMRVHALYSVRTPRPAPGAMHAATAADRDLLLSWLRVFSAEAMPKHPQDDAEHLARLARATGYFWSDGQPVAMCMTSRPTPNGLCVHGVYTPAELRGRGYASCLVAAVSQRILDSGRRFAYLYTDLANPTSNKIYAAIGYEPVYDVQTYAFE